MANSLAAILENLDSASLHLHTKADGSRGQTDAELPKKKQRSSDESSQTQTPVVGVLLEGIAAKGEKEDASKRKAEQMFQDLGLGRGIDATRTRPWLNRTSFQVRPVHFDHLIGTEEGGSLEAYELVALSSQCLQMKMQAELAVPISSGTAPVSPKVQIGVDCDYARTISMGRRVIGRRVVNRSIGFREEFQDLPFSHQFCSPIMPTKTARNSDEKPHAFKCTPECCYYPSSLTFEEGLSKWVLERLAHCHSKEEEVCKHPWPVDGHLKEIIEQKQSPSIAFTEWFLPFELDQTKLSEKHESVGTSLEECIQSLCLQFVKFFHVTHYVSAIKLGATEYAVMTESTYLEETKSTGKFGLEGLVTSHVTASEHSKKSLKVSKLRKIGAIVMGEGGAVHVPRSSQKEAVIRVEIKPIYRLVRNEFLGRYLQKAVLQYIEDQKDPRMGPFYIASHGMKHETVYLAVNEALKDEEKLKAAKHCEDDTAPDKNCLLLCATTRKDSATPFKIIQSDEGDGLNEFNIVYEKEDIYPQEQASLCHCRSTTVSQVDPDEVSLSSYRTSNKLKSSAWYYLCAPLTVRGTSSSPPCFKLRSRKKDCLFVLRSPLKSGAAPSEDLDPWLSGVEEFFIHCSGHRFQKNGYLAVRSECQHAGGAEKREDSGAKKSRQDSTRYVPTCCSSRNTGEHHFMVFKLLPVGK